MKLSVLLSFDTIQPGKKKAKRIVFTMESNLE